MASKNGPSTTLTLPGMPFIDNLLDGGIHPGKLYGIVGPVGVTLIPGSCLWLMTSGWMSSCRKLVAEYRR